MTTTYEELRAAADRYIADRNEETARALVLALEGHEVEEDHPFLRYFDEGRDAKIQEIVKAFPNAFPTLPMPGPKPRG